MCQQCLDALRELFPEVPLDEGGKFLFGTTCYPFGYAATVREQLAANRARMTGTDYHECYAIADRDMDEVMARRTRDGT